jgi:diketogulonate reductase-like aldo/keto reductase
VIVEAFLNEKTYAIIDELEVIAKAHETTVASVALAWVQAQPAVTSVIIGARRLSQLDDNVGAVDVNLTAEELAGLNALTEPTFGFPQSMLTTVPSITNGGTTVNGVSAPISDYVMPEGNQPY